MSASLLKTVLVTGGAGYVGSVLVPRLLEAGHAVRVLDLYLYGDHVFDGVRGDPRLEEVKGDIRDRAVVARSMAGVDAVIHLACISNDPSFELDPDLGRSINYDAFVVLVDEAKRAGVKRFVYASSSSVYGVKSEPNVTEELALEPLTDYSKYKAMCEKVLLDARAPGFTTLTIRPATVCGWSPRLRLDLTVNILTNHAINNGRITVFGGAQLRPNIHIDDMADLYVESLRWEDGKIDGETFNVGFENHSVSDIAEMVRSVVGPEIEVTTVPTNDNRSYQISSGKIERALGFRPKRTIVDAVKDLAAAFADGRIPDPMTDDRYYNIKLMQRVKLR